MTKDTRTYSGVKTACSINGDGKIGQAGAKKKKGYQFKPHTRINWKWIKYLNLSCETIKVIEENISSKISDSSHGNIFTNMSAQTKKKKKGKITQMGLN